MKHQKTYIVKKIHSENGKDGSSWDRIYVGKEIQITETVFLRLKKRVDFDKFWKVLDVLTEVTNIVEPSPSASVNIETLDKPKRKYVRKEKIENKTAETNA